MTTAIVECWLKTHPPLQVLASGSILMDIMRGPSSSLLSRSISKIMPSSRCKAFVTRLVVDIGCVEISGPVFVLEVALQQLISGPRVRWERTQCDSVDDESLHISVTSTD